MVCLQLHYTINDKIGAVVESFSPNPLKLKWPLTNDCNSQCQNLRLNRVSSLYSQYKTKADLRRRIPNTVSNGGVLPTSQYALYVCTCERGSATPSYRMETQEKLLDSEYALGEL